MLPGLWRLRLPLPWPGVPHGNAYAIAAGSGVVLVDTGLSRARLASVSSSSRSTRPGCALEHVRLVVCTHAHSDHYGMAAPIIQAAGCELWMHPNHAHMTQGRERPGACLRAAL